MALVIRFRQQGRKNQICYRLVVTDQRSPRDGKYVEMLGWYNPHVAEDKGVSVNAERLSYWLNQGAQISEKAEAIVMKVSPNTIKEYNEKKLQKQQKKKA